MVKGDGELTTQAPSLLPLIAAALQYCRCRPKQPERVSVMSVIGRLDGQVDEIIIKPVADRNRPETEERPPSSKENARQPQPATEEDRTQDTEESDERSSDLPVWLL
jgi:hypothetical protein